MTPQDTDWLGAVDIALVRLDADGLIASCNSAALELLGRVGDDLRGHPLVSLVEPDLVATSRDGPPTLPSEPFSNLPVLLRAGDGTTRFATCSRQPLGAGALLTFHDTAGRRWAPEAVRAELQRHQALADVQRRIDKAWADLDAVYRIVADAAASIVTAAGAAALEVVDHDASVLRVTTDPSFAELGMRVPLAGSLVGAALESGQALVCRDTEADDRLNRERSRHYGVRSMVVVPVPHAGRIIGALKISAREPDAFGPRDLLVAHVLVGHITTAHARADEELALRHLRRTEQRLQLALEAVDTIGLFDWDIRQDRCIGDARFWRLMGVAEPAADGGLPILQCFSHVNADDFVWIKAAGQRAVAEGGDLALEFRVEVPGRALTWLSTHGRRISAPAGGAEHFVGAVVDVTERKRIETSLREAETNARLAVESAGLGLWHYDPSLDRLQWDERCRAIFNPPADAEPSLDWVLDCVHPDSRTRVRAFAEQMVQGGAPLERAHEFEINRPGEEGPRWVDVSAQTFFTEGRVTRIIGTVSDITEKVRAREAQLRFGEEMERQVELRTEELRRANARLLGEMADRQRIEEALRQSQKMEAVGQLTGGIAHDFNNLLTGISGSLELMRKRIAQGRMTDVERYMAAAATSANRAAALTHRLLAFARRQPLDAKPVRLNHLAASLEDLFRRTLGESIEIVFDLAPDLWTTLCDPHQLENALLNLVINARDAMPDGGRLIIRTGNRVVAPDEVRAAPDTVAGDFATLSVSDTGSGMDPEVMVRIFEPFFTTKPIGQGTGLGLSMIYGFARQSEGSVSVSSAQGEGSTFTLLLPRYYGEDEEGRRSEPAEEAVGNGETVLVVEDDPVVRGLVLEVLAELGYATLQAHEGLGGLAILQGRAGIDLLVTDVGLPGLNGRQLAELGRASRPDLKVLFITGYAESLTFGAGPDDPRTQMITKPFEIDDLTARIRTMITLT